MLVVHRSVHLRDEDAEPRDLVFRHVVRVLELPALCHGQLSFLENARDIVVTVVLGFLVVVGHRLVVALIVVPVVVVVVLCRRRRLPCSTTRRRWTIKGEVPDAEEARPPPRILLGLAKGALDVGIEGVGGIGVEVRRQVPPPTPNLGAWLARRHGRDRHPEVAQPPAVRHVHVPQPSHDV
jgi:hypothetical protein